MAMRAVAKKLWVTVAGAEAEETGQVNRERGEAEAMGRGSMVTAAAVTAARAVVRVVAARVEEATGATAAAKAAAAAATAAAKAAGM